MPAPAAQLRPGPRGEVAGWVAAALLAVILFVPLTAAWTQAQDLGHGWGAPLLVGYLWWERWGERPPGVGRERLGARWWAAGAMLAILALPLRLLLTPFPLWPAALAAYVAVVVAVALGGAWLAAGAAGLKWLGGPLIILFGAMPWPTMLEVKIVGPMREILASVAAEVCYLAGISALATGTALRLAHSWVGVDETCGGMRSLQACVMAALFLGEWLRLSWARRAGLAAVGIVAAIVGNFLRILLLVWRASVGGEPALAAAHDLAGWLALGTSLGLIGLVARKMRDAPDAAARPATPPAPPTVLSRPALAWIGTLAAALLLIETGTRWWYARGATRQAATIMQWGARFPSRQTGFHEVPLSDAARDMLRPDYFAAGEWETADQRLNAAYYIEWRKGQAAHSIPFLHNPTVCLPMSGCELVRPIATLPVRWAGGEIPFQAFIFRRAGEEFAVAFTVWDPSRGRPLENESSGWQSWIKMRFNHVLEARADQPAQMLTVAVWGDRPEAHIAAAIASVISSL